MFSRFSFAHLLVVAMAAGCSQSAAIPIDVPVSGGSDVFLPPEGRTIEGVFPRRSTLAGLLDTHELDGPAARDVIAAAGIVFDPRRFRAGNEYKVVVANDGSLRRFEYHVDEDQFLQVRRAAADETYHAALVPYDKQRVEAVARGFINHEHTSLVSALNGGGERGVTGPNPRFSSDLALANASVAKLATFRFETVVFGHGEPVVGGASGLVAALAAEL